MTRRLYHHDAFLRQFTATVIAHARHGDRPSVVLDATAFYPEAGGQMADRGSLGGIAVVDVQADDAGVVHHVLGDGAAAPPVGSTAIGCIDWARRRIHMALHTGQHVLSRALIERAAAETVSARLGETGCTIDVTRDAVPERELAAAEDLANAVIDDDLAIRAWFPEPAELAGLPLRREPKVASEVRVIAVGEFDVSPCGGTHCARTAQIGLLRVLGVERYKGMTRVHFEAGARVRAVLAGHHDLVARLARELTCAPAEVPGAIDKLRRSLAEARADATALRDQLAAALAAELVARDDGGAMVIATLADAALLRPVAARLTAAGKDALLAAPGADGMQVVIARATGSPRDCGALVRRLAQAAGGRGGGRADHAEGRLPAGVEWAAALAAADVA